MAKQEEQKHSAVEDLPDFFDEDTEPRPIVTVKTRWIPASTGEEEKQKAAAPQIVQPSQPSKWMRRRQLLIGGVGVLASVVGLGEWLWHEWPHRISQAPRLISVGDLLVTRWNEAALLAIHALQPPIPVAARALAIVHTCMFDAWAAYHPTALGTQLKASLRQPANTRTPANKSEAISYAAYRALVDLFPTEQAHFSRLMYHLGYSPSDNSAAHTPASIGNIAAQAVLALRHRDGANQLGNLAPGAYADYTKYQPANLAGALDDPNRWQPLLLSDPRLHLGGRVQQFECPQWADVKPFALSSATQFMPQQGPPRYPDPRYIAQAQQIVEYSAGLTDEQKVIAEYWTYGSEREQAVSRWSGIAQFISRRDRHTLDQNVQMFFALANAVLDTSIACWAAKRAYDAVYPVTAIRFLFGGQQIQAWAGPGKGTQRIDGQNWSPYQPAGFLAPSFPEYCSEQSALSAAAAQVLRRFTGSDRLNLSYTQAARSSQIEPGVPARSVTLSWPTFSLAARQAGQAGRYAGIHFAQSDLDGSWLGSRVGELAWLKAQSYINGSAHV